MHEIFYNNFTAEKTFLKKFSSSPKVTLLMIHRFIEEYSSSNLQQSLKSSSENNTETSTISESFNRMKLLRIESQPFGGIDLNPSLGNIQKMTYLKSLLLGSALSMISDFKLFNENCSSASNFLRERFDNKQF